MQAFSRRASKRTQILLSQLIKKKNVSYFLHILGCWFKSMWHSISCLLIWPLNWGLKSSTTKWVSKCAHLWILAYYLQHLKSNHLWNGWDTRKMEVRLQKRTFIVDWRPLYLTNIFNVEPYITLPRIFSDHIFRCICKHLGIDAP